MKIAIIGAGFTGLSAAYQLTKLGHSVTVFEKDPQPGGLAIGYQEKEWDWTLEKHYHHWFANDFSVLNLAKEINHKVYLQRPKTAVYVDKGIYQFDGPVQLLKFPRLSMLQKIRMGIVLAVLRYNPIWKPFEKIKANSFLLKAMGKEGYEKLWKPQFTNKFGKYIDEISLAWFWARIKKRTPSLAYPQGGFLTFANKLVSKIERQGGKVLFQQEIIELKDDNKNKITVKYKDNKEITKTENFDKAIVTLPSFLFLKIAPQLPEKYKHSLKRLKGLGATNLVLRLNKQFFKDGTYWLSICQESSTVMAVVEHTNLLNKKNYNNEHILYLGNYVPADHEYFLMNEKEMLKRFDPFLKQLNKDYKKTLIGMKLFKAPFAQPIIPINYSKIIPPMVTPLPDVILANIEQVYPWDRGTNYAVELGEKAAKLVLQ